MKQLFKYCGVGGFGFLVDALLFLVVALLIDPVIMARLLAFWGAATATWLGNRYFTFSKGSQSPRFKQWCKHMLTAHVSGAVNLLVFTLLISQIPIPFAFVIGVVSAMSLNFFLAKRYVFAQN